MRPLRSVLEADAAAEDAIRAAEIAVQAAKDAKTPTPSSSSRFF